MNDEALDAFILGYAEILGIDVQPDWLGSIRANMAVTFRLGGMVLDFPLPDEAEPAPVFTA